MHVVWELGAARMEVAAEKSFVFEGRGEDFTRWQEIFIGGFADGHRGRQCICLWLIVGDEMCCCEGLVDLMYVTRASKGICIQQSEVYSKHEIALLRAYLGIRAISAEDHSECVASYAARHRSFDNTLARNRGEKVKLQGSMSTRGVTALKSRSASAASDRLANS